MTSNELFALPVGSRVRSNYPGPSSTDGVIIVRQTEEVLIRWADDDISSIGRNDDECEELAWVSSSELTADTPITVQS